MRIVFILLLFVLAGCNGGNGGVDAGDSGDAGAEDGEKTGDGDGDPGTDRAEDGDYGDDGSLGDAPTDGTAGDADGGMEPDEDLGDELGLQVFPGTCVCVSTSVSLNPDLDFGRKGRICFRPGLHRLTRDQQTFEVDLIESVELGAGALVATPTGPGVFTGSPPPQPDGDYSFVFHQEFTAAETPFSFSLQVTFRCDNSEPITNVLYLNDEGFCSRQYWTSATWGDTSIYMGHCQYSLYGCGIIRYNLEGGDVFQTETCRYCPVGWICKSSMAGMRRAEFKSGTESRYQGDYFGLVYSMRHHDWGSDSLARFDQVLGSVQAIYAGTNEYPDHLNYSEVTYLDGDLNVLETRSVTSVEYLNDW